MCPYIKRVESKFLSFMSCHVHRRNIKGLGCFEAFFRRKKNLPLGEAIHLLVLELSASPQLKMRISGVNVV